MCTKDPGSILSTGDGRGRFVTSIGYVPFDDYCIIGLACANTNCIGSNYYGLAALSFLRYRSKLRIEKGRYESGLEYGSMRLADRMELPQLM